MIYIIAKIDGLSAKCGVAYVRRFLYEDLLEALSEEPASCVYAYSMNRVHI